MVSSSRSRRRAGSQRSGPPAARVREWLATAERGDLPALKRLLAAVPRLLDASGRGPYWQGRFRALHYAVYRHHRDVVRWLLGAGASADPVAGDADWAPIHFAAFDGRRDMVRLLTRHGAAMDVFAAAALGEAATVRRMLRADPALVTRRGPDRVTPLHFAATPEVARALLAAGADPAARDGFHGGTPLDWVARRPAVAAVVAVAAGMDIDIHLACAIGDVARVRALVAQDPRAANRKAGKKGRTVAVPGETPLGIAARYGQRRVVDFLIERGAAARTDPSPLPDAVPTGDVVIVKRLLDAGADPNAFCAHGHAALHLAARDGKIAIIRLLLARGARHDLRDREHDSTPLGWAEYHRRARAAALLGSSDRTTA